MVVGITGDDRNMAGFQNLENPVQVELFEFYFIYSSAILLMVFKCTFSLLFSNKMYLFLWCIKFSRLANYLILKLLTVS